MGLGTDRTPEGGERPQSIKLPGKSPLECPVQELLGTNLTDVECPRDEPLGDLGVEQWGRGWNLPRPGSRRAFESPKSWSNLRRLRIAPVSPLFR